VAGSALCRPEQRQAKAFGPIPEPGKRDIGEAGISDFWVMSSIRVAPEPGRRAGLEYETRTGKPGDSKKTQKEPDHDRS
jgi:hypothetical protein